MLATICAIQIVILEAALASNGIVSTVHLLLVLRLSTLVAVVFVCIADELRLIGADALGHQAIPEAMAKGIGRPVMKAWKT
jgi:hypothetical protein